MTKRFMVDDAGTLIDMSTRDTYDYVSDVVELLNALNDENEQLKSKLFDVELELEHSKESNDDAYYELTQIKKENDDLKRGILKDIFADECEEYKKENEQLKTVIGRYDFSVDRKNDEINNLHLDYLKLEKENEQLKSELRNLRRLANELYMEGSE